jgi:hypothetical protein
MSGLVTQLKYPDLRFLSPVAQQAARWFHQLARGARMSRLYPSDNPHVVQIRGQLLEQLNPILAEHGAWRMRITPIEIWLVDEAIVHPSNDPDLDALSAKAERLPFIFYRDGIRGLTFLPQVPVSDFEAFFNALAAADRGPSFHDDMVTLLWQAHPVQIQVEAVPVTQTIYLSSRRAAEGRGRGLQGLAFGWSPTGDEIRSEIGQVAGAAQGLHRDTFDDWPLPKSYVDVPTAYAALTKGIQFVRSVLLTEWSSERGADWTTEVPPLFRKVLALDPGPDTRAALSQSLVTWVVGAAQRQAWAEAQQALALLREFDPDGGLSLEHLTNGMAGLDNAALVEGLDEASPGELSRFLALAVAMGSPALDLGCSVMALAEKSRTRAVACTLLCYLCSDQPDLLAPYLSDERWFVVRNAVFVLGQIGGHEVAELLRFAAAHADPRVRRQVVVSLGNVPPEERFPILASQLGTSDVRLLSTTLGVLARQRGPEVTRALLRQVQARNFESRGLEPQRLLLGALAEMGDDSVVPTLAALVHKGGWFARPTPQRLAAAQALARIGTEPALAVLEEGLRTGNEAVRAACLEALGSGGGT